MFAKLQTWYTDQPTGAGLVLGFTGLVLAAVLVAVGSGYYFLAGVPVIGLVVYLAIVDFRQLYWLLIAAIPISTEIVLPNGLGTDLPTEPLIVGLMLLFGVFVLQHLSRLSTDLLRHPITLLLLLHVSWIACTTITSDLFVVSLKFLFAKIWYVVTFYGLTAYLVRDEADFRRLFWIFFWPFLAVVVIVMTRHALLGFSFQGIHSIMHPFQRNHVNYAATLSIFYPFLVMMLGQARRWSWQYLLLLGTVLLVFVAIYFSFTRAAYVALFAAAGMYYVIRWRLTRFALLGTGLAVVIGVVYFVHENTYLDYAPNYDRTISHEQFDNLIEATYKMEDISTMERVYRWVAAGHMAPERPLLGWGPGNFVNFYKPFAVTSFQTYVSDNPEKSGIHSYYFMTLVEQGIPGLLLFLMLLVVIFLHGERLYHRLADQPYRQQMVMTLLLSLTVIAAFLIINDQLENDKVGSFFFINLAILVNQDLFLLREKRKAA
jgi:O-antigen ligase